MYPKMECKGDGHAKVQGGNKGFIEASEVNGLANDRRIGHFSQGDRLLSLKKSPSMFYRLDRLLNQKF